MISLGILAVKIKKTERAGKIKRNAFISKQMVDYF